MCDLLHQSHIIPSRRERELSNYIIFLVGAACIELHHNINKSDNNKT